MTKVRNLGEAVSNGCQRIENRHQSLESDVRVVLERRIRKQVNIRVRE